MQIEIKPLTYSVAEAAKVLGVSKQTMYDVCHVDDFPVIRIGRCIKIPIEAFHIWIENQAGGRQ